LHYFYRLGQLSRFYLTTERESSLWNVVFQIQREQCLDKNRTVDNVQKYNVCINLPSSQARR
jgi:hypothetical protein